MGEKDQQINKQQQKKPTQQNTKKLASVQALLSNSRNIGMLSN